MISFDGAIALISSIATPRETETLPLGRAAGRVLASPVCARVDSPRTDVSVMDGYAVRRADLAELPLELEIIGRSLPGAAWSGNVPAGTCVRIMTGAPVPPGTDLVIIQEDVERRGDVARILRFDTENSFIRRRASDFRDGDELLHAGRLLDPRALVVAAAADVHSLELIRRPRFRIVSTGDELAEPGTARDSRSLIPESVSFGIAAMGREHGAECVETIRLSDDLELMQRAAAAACDGVDLVVITGGASVGERDHAKQMFARLGIELLFSSVAMKPGKPAWLGRSNDRLVLGLPGNPTSALVTARLLMAPLLAMMLGREMESALRWKSAPLASRVGSCGDRETFHRGTIKDGLITILPSQDSGSQLTLSEASILVRQAARSGNLEPGSNVEFVEF